MAPSEPRAPSDPSTSGRKIVFAVDGTSDAETGLQWVAKELAQKGEAPGPRGLAMAPEAVCNPAQGQALCCPTCPLSTPSPPVQLRSPGDTIYLAHVLCDARTPATAVGSSAAATQWSPGRDEAVFAKVHLQAGREGVCSVCVCGVWGGGWGGEARPQEG